jgi:hypothetical protein
MTTRSYSPLRAHPLFSDYSAGAYDANIPSSRQRACWTHVDAQFPKSFENPTQFITDGTA